MKILTIITSFLILTASKPIIMNTNASLYDISINSITGEPINFGNFKGKKILIVNTASECGLQVNMRIWKNYIKHIKIN